MEKQMIAKKNLKVYLSGPMPNVLSGSNRFWREKIKKELCEEYEILDPTDKFGKAFDPFTIVAEDLSMIDGCNFMLAFIPKVTIGTSMELFYAKAENKPIVLVDNCGIIFHPWVRFCTGDKFITDSLDKAINLIRLNF